MGDTWAELWDRHDGLTGPLAAELPAAATLLGAPLAAVQAAARHVAPYIAHDGTPKWSVAELGERLGLAARDNRGQRIMRRTGDRNGPARRHARAGAAVTNGRRARWAAPAVEDPPGPDVEDLAANGGH